MKYKILKKSKYSSKGFDVIVLEVGDVVELPDSIGVPFSEQGLCKPVKDESKAEADKKAKLDKKAKAEAEKKAADEEAKAKKAEDTKK